MSAGNGQLGDKKIIDSPDVFSACIEGGLRQFGSILPNKTLNTMFVPGDNHFRQLVKNKGKVTFPFLAVKLTGVTLDRERRNISSMMRNGVPIRVGNNVKEFEAPERVVSMHMAPVIINMNAKFVTNTYEEAIEFSKRLLLTRVQGTGVSLRFDLVISDNVFNCNSEVDDDIQIPEWDMNDDTGTIIPVDFSYRILGYTGYVTQQAVINQYNINFTTVGNDDKNPNPVTESFRSNF